MKTTPNRPRFVCRAARLWSAIASSRHVETCAECHAYLESAGALERSLRRDAPAWAEATPEPSPGFEQRLRRLARPAAASTRESGSHGWWVVATALTAAVAVGFFRPTGGPSDSTTQADAAMLAAALETASRGLVETVIPSTGAFVADNPLQREFTAIRSDARSALSFLAMNFLPGNAVADASFSPARPL